MSPSLTPARVIEQLNNVSEAHITDIVSHDVDGNESLVKRAGSSCSILEKFYNVEESTAIKAVCTFIVANFDEICLTALKAVSSKRSVEERSKKNLWERHAEFMLVCCETREEVENYS